MVCRKSKALFSPKKSQKVNELPQESHHMSAIIAHLLYNLEAITTDMTVLT